MTSEGIVPLLPKSPHLSAYSPDLSAMDQFFAKLEDLLGKAGDRQETLRDEREVRGRFRLNSALSLLATTASRYLTGGGNRLPPTISLPPKIIPA
jgi:hypothetical protein